jgi:hypothetical protein
LIPIALLAAGLANTLWADGLSWTDATRDRLCDPANVKICPEASINQLDGTIAGVKFYTLFAHVSLWIYAKEGAATMNVTVVAETTDHVKHTYQAKVPIKTDERRNPDGSRDSLRSCNAIFEHMEKGLISVLSIDALEANAAGDTLARHEFR